MVRICLFCLPLLLATEAARAQLFSSKVALNDTGKIYLRFSAFGLIDVLDGNFTVGGEYRFNKSWSVTMDAGYIFYSRYVIKSDRSGGILLRSGIRKYAGKKLDYFFELQFHYKEVMYHVNDWIERDVVDGMSAYEQLTTFRYLKRVFGVQVLSGGKEFLTRDHRLFLEVTAGLGLHYKITGPYHENNSRYEDPYALVVNSKENLSTPPTRTVVPALPINIRLVYRLR